MHSLETLQDFLRKLGIKPPMHLCNGNDILLSLNRVTVRPNKILNKAVKKASTFLETKYLENQSFQKSSFLKVGLLVKYSSQKIQKDFVDF